MRTSLKKNKPALKGVYTLNPTRAVMKQGSKAARKAVATTLTTATKYNKPIKAKGK